MEHENAEPHVFPNARKPGELLFAIGFLVFSLALLSQIGWQTSWLAGKGFAAQPRTWPLIGLGGMTLFGLLHLIATNRSKRTPGRWKEARLWLASLEYVLWYLIYVFAVPQIGYLPATLAFCLFVALRVGYRSKGALVSAGAFAFFVVLLFKTTLHVKIPGGAVYEYLPGALRNFMIVYF